MECTRIGIDGGLRRGRRRLLFVRLIDYSEKQMMRTVIPRATYYEDILSRAGGMDAVDCMC